MSVIKLKLLIAIYLYAQRPVLYTSNPFSIPFDLTPDLNKYVPCYNSNLLSPFHAQGLSVTVPLLANRPEKPLK